MNTYNGTVRLYLHDILSGKRTLINTAWRYPDVPVIIHYGQITARSGGKTVLVYSFHEHNQLVCRMHQLKFHFYTLFLFSLAYIIPILL